MSLALASRRAAIGPAWVKNPLWRTARAVPSLDQPFADTKSLVDAVTGQSLVTFTRASSGTSVGSDGLLKTATTNLLLRSEEFDNAYWTKSGATVSADQTASPIGSVTADKLIESAANSEHWAGRLSLSLPSAIYTCSIYAKAAERQSFSIFLDTSATRRTAYFNLSNGTLGAISTGITSSIQNIGNGWYRCSITLNAAESISNAVYTPAIGNSNLYLGDGTSGIYIWGAQLEQSSTVGEYIPTTSTINSAPRFDHNPTTGESLGLLVEEQRTNLLLRSEEFDNASWVKTLATVTANVTTAPDGSVAADKLIGNSTIDSHYAQQNISGATNGISYTSSVYAKASEITRIEILHAVGATLYVQGYDLSSGTLLTRVTAGTTAATGGFIQAVGNGWYRCGITQTSDGTTGAVRVTLRSANTVNFDATSQGVLLWGAQLEAGAFPTSYIPTTTAAATRSADVASITGTAFSSWYRQDEGTVFASTSVSAIAPTTLLQTQYAIHDGSTDNRITIYKRANADTSTRLDITAATVSSAFINAGTFGLNNLTASAIRANDFAVSLNGLSAVVDTSGNVPSVNQITLGSYVGATGFINGTIRRLTYWPARLSNSTLQAITQ